MIPPLICVLCGLLLAAPPRTQGKAAPRPRPPRAAQSNDSAVDQVQVRQGPKLRGAILNRTARGDITIAVERTWLEQAAPDYFAQLTSQEVTEARTAWQELQVRLAEWRRRHAGEERLLAYIEAEEQRAAQELRRLEPPEARLREQFVIIDLAARQVEQFQAQSAERRQIALVAWREQLADVATRSAESLSQELASLGIEAAAERINLGDRLPIRRQSDREWQARRAILEYVERQSLDYQGTRDLLVRTDAGQDRPDLAALLTQTMQSQLTSVLDDLLNDGGAGPRRRPTPAKGLEKAQREAGELKIDGLRGTVLTLDVDQLQASVDQVFQARLENGRWITAWNTREIQKSGGGDDEQRRRIRNDPQVKQALELLKSTGLAADDAVETALGVGSATMTAQERANAAFAQFLGLYRHHAEGPPLFLPEGE